MVATRGSRTEPGQGGDRDLAVAIVSGVALAGVFVASVLVHPAGFAALVAVLAVLGIVETSRVLDGHGWPVAVPAAVAASLLTLAAAYLAGPRGVPVGLVVLFVGTVAWELAGGRQPQATRRIAATVLIGTWFGLLGSYGVLLVTLPDGGWAATFAVVGAAVVSDVGAYVVGTRVGRRRLAPSVSPGKTWEGALGGVALAAVAIALLVPALGDPPLLPWWQAALLGAVVGTAAVVGDLAESLVKRDLGVKDFGAIIPGHGGVLDRVDGILFGLPTGYYAIVLLTSL